MIILSTLFLTHKLWIQTTRIVGSKFKSAAALESQRCIFWKRTRYLLSPNLWMILAKSYHSHMYQMTFNWSLMQILVVHHLQTWKTHQKLVFIAYADLFKFHGLSWYCPFRNGLCYNYQFLHTNTNTVTIDLQKAIGCIENVQDP